MSQVTMEELQRAQDELKEEVKQLKTQMSLVMEILQTVLKREGNATPVSMMEMVSLVHQSFFTSCHELPQGYHS